MIEPRPGMTPAELIPGEPAEIERLAGRLGRFATGAADASTRLGGLDAEHWSGTAADLFRQAVGPMPQQLSRAGGAFAMAARALTGYAQALREGQVTAGQAIQMVETATPDSAGADREAARRMVERARGEVAEAARVAAVRLSELAADAPTDAASVSSSAAGPALRAGDVSISAVIEHELADPEGFVGPTDEVSDSVRYGADHAVAFAGGAAGGEASTGWTDWAGAGESRQLGAVEPAAMAALGIGAIGLIGRWRRNRTALTTAGIDDDELRRRRDRLRGPRHHDGHTTRTRVGGPRSADAWRTRLASVPRADATVHVWAGSEANPLVRTRVAEPVPMTPPGQAVPGAVLRTGPPPDEGRRGPGAMR